MLPAPRLFLSKPENLCLAKAREIGSVANLFHEKLSIVNQANKATLMSDVMNWRNNIHSDRKILLGKPVIRGTRISVELILELFANGWTYEMVLESYPHVTRDDISAVFLYLKEAMQQELFFPLQPTEG